MRNMDMIKAVEKLENTRNSKDTLQSRYEQTNKNDCLERDDTFDKMLKEEIDKLKLLDK